MDELLTTLFRLINGSVTLWLSHLLYGTYRVNRRRFYKLWAFGFFFYGASILVRLIPENILISTNLSIFSFLLLYIGFSAMLVALGDLVNRGNLMTVFSIILLLFNFFMYLMSGEWIQTSILVGLLQFLLILMSLLIIQLRWKINLELVTIGWVNVLLTNIALTSGALDPGYTEIFSTINKVILYSGITRSRFNYIVEELQKFFISGVPIESVVLEKGSISLVYLANETRSREIRWIKERVDKNSQKGINTIFIVCYDLITASSLLSDSAPEHLYIVRLVGGNISPVKIFDKHIMTLSDDINQLDVLFTDIINYSEERRFPCEIIFYSFSHMIHTHGWKRMYSFLISKIVEIKSSNIHLIGFYYPKTHLNTSEVTMLENIADKIITG